MTPTAKEQFRKLYEREHATTVRVLQAFPPDKAAFKPAERANSAQALAWTMVAEERMILLALQGKEILGSGIAMNPPGSWAEILAAFDDVHQQVLEELSAPANANLEGSVRFFTGPKQVGDIPTRDFVVFMMSDQIHHRGQMSVYLRIVGARVPSIYGPSGDEPWN